MNIFAKGSITFLKLFSNKACVVFGLCVQKVFLEQRCYMLLTTTLKSCYRNCSYLLTQIWILVTKIAGI